MKQEEIVVPCPHCGSDNLITPINKIDLEGENFERLLRGDINIIICFSCSNEFSYQTPLYSYLEEYNYLIFLNEDLVNLDRNSINTIAEELMKKFIGKKTNKDYFLRITLNRNSFIEKIFLINNSLNDKLIEYIKFQLYRKEKQYTFPRYRLFYDYSNKDETLIQFCVFDEQANKISTKLQIKKFFYTELLNEYNKNILKLDNFFSSYFVDVEKFFN